MTALPLMLAKLRRRRGRTIDRAAVGVLQLIILALALSYGLAKVAVMLGGVS